MNLFAGKFTCYTGGTDTESQRQVFVQAFLLWFWTMLPVLQAERLYKFLLWYLEIISQKRDGVIPSLKLIKQLCLFFTIVRTKNRRTLKKMMLLTVLLQTVVWQKCHFYLKAIRGHLWGQCPGADLPVPCLICTQVGIWLGLKLNYKQTNKIPSNWKNGFWLAQLINNDRVKSALWINLDGLVKQAHLKNTNNTKSKVMLLGKKDIRYSCEIKEYLGLHWCWKEFGGMRD